MTQKLLSYETRIKELEAENSYLKKKQLEITKAKELYLKIFDDFPALIWRSRLDKLCDYFNKTWLEFTGRTMEQEFGNGWAENVHPEDFNYCLDIYVTAFDKREAFLMEYRMKNKYGEYRWIRDFGRPFYDLDNTFLGYIGSCYDVTEIKNNELKLIELNSTKNRFISILAHDLKDPFNIILGYLEILTQNLRKFDIDKIENHLNIINDSSKKTFKLLEDILLWIRAESGKLPFEPIEYPISVLFETVVEYLQPIADKKGISINYFTDNDLLIKVDVNMISTILRNLISNAVKFSLYGGSISVYSEIENNQVIITVSDNGIGIEQETIPFLFNISRTKSTQGTSNEKGTGLGLLICKDFVEKHGGKIWVESEIGKGSDFKFSIPL